MSRFVDIERLQVFYNQLLGPKYNEGKGEWAGGGGCMAGSAVSVQRVSGLKPLNSGLVLLVWLETYTCE